MHNVQGALRAHAENTEGKWRLSLLPLHPLEKVPSDIEVGFYKKPEIGSSCYLCQVARAQTPKDISVLAHEIGLLPSEVLTTIA